MEFRILGPVEILDDAGASVRLRGSRERVLLALLLCEANRVVAAERLTDGLWGARAPQGATHALQVHISRLRGSLHEAGGDEMLLTRPPGYVLQVDPTAIDATRFEALVEKARDQAATGDHPGAAASFSEALGLWRGPALADVAEAPGVQVQTARLEEARLAALEDRVDADLARGQHGPLVAELDVLTRAHPLRERLWAQRMTALYRSGRQAEALRAYQELRTTLGEGLGLEPSEALVHLEGRILCRDPDLDWRPEPAPDPEEGRGGTDTGALPMPAFLTEVGRVFVARDRELGILDRLWTHARLGVPQVALIAGEPGVGKTRLAAEHARRLRLDGATVLAGRCDEDLGVPYQPFVEALRQYVEHTPAGVLGAGLGRHAGELVRLVPDVAERLPGLAPPLRSDPDTERYRLFEAVVAWLAAASAGCPVLLVLDDLQWAAKPTLLLLRHVVTASEVMRLLVLGAYRDTEVPEGHPLTDVLAGVRQHTELTHLPLAGFDGADVARFMTEVAGHDMDDDGLALAELIHRETEGNPFFVREVLRHLTETGTIVQRDGRWETVKPLRELTVPDGVRQVVARRLSLLSTDANRLLRVAAVMGSEFELPVAGTACGVAGEALVSALEEAVAGRLVVEGGDAAHCRFTHALVRDVLYRELSAVRRVAFHARTAEALEARYGAALDHHLPALARHWARASPGAPTEVTAKAVEYAVRAGDRALDQLAHDEAADHYASAVELLDAAGTGREDPRRLELLIRKGEAQRRAGSPDHRETLLEAARLAEQAGDVGALARAALANGRGDIPSATFAIDTDRVAVLEAAVAAVGEDDLGLRARLLANLGLELYWQDDPEKKTALSDEALRIAGELGDAETLAHVLLARDYTIISPDNSAERFEATGELLAIAERLGDPVLVSRGLCLRFRAAMEVGEVAEGEDALMENEAVVADLGQPALSWLVMHHRAAIRLLRGDPDAEAAIVAAYDLGVQVGQPGVEMYSLPQWFSLYVEQGRLADVEASVHGALGRSQNPAVKVIYAHILAETDRLEAAAAIFEEFAASGFTHPRNSLWLRIVTECAWICCRLGRVDCVAQLRSMLEPYAERLVPVAMAGAITGSVSHYLGLLAATAHGWAQAKTHFAAAASTHERIAAPDLLARTRVEWARMLLAQGEPMGAERAQQLLNQALVTAQRRGLTAVERDAVELRASDKR